MERHLILNAGQEAQFRKWARDNYVPHEAIDGTWHPVVQAECAKINEENNMVPIEDLFPAEVAP